MPARQKLASSCRVTGLSEMFVTLVSTATASAPGCHRRLWDAANFPSATRSTVTATASSLSATRWPTSCSSLVVELLRKVRP